MTPHDDLATLLHALEDAQAVFMGTDWERHYGNEALAARARLEAELARLEAQITALTQERDEAVGSWGRWMKEGTDQRIRAEAAEAALAENNRITEMRRVEGKRILDERNEAVAALADTRRALAEREAALWEIRNLSTSDMVATNHLMRRRIADIARRALAGDTKEARDA